MSPEIRTRMCALIEFEIRRAAGTQAACPGNPPVQPGTAGSTVVQTESREVWGILQRHFTRTRSRSIFNFQQVALVPRLETFFIYIYQRLT